MDFQEMINETFPLYEDMNDTEVAQTIWRRRGAEILGERLKQQMIEKACEQYRFELKQLDHMLSKLNEDYAGLIDIEGSVKDYRKTMEE